MTSSRKSRCYRWWRSARILAHKIISKKRPKITYKIRTNSQAVEQFGKQRNKHACGLSRAKISWKRSCLRVPQITCAWANLFSFIFFFVFALGSRPRNTATCRTTQNHCQAQNDRFWTRSLFLVTTLDRQKIFQCRIHEREKETIEKIGYLVKLTRELHTV